MECTRIWIFYSWKKLAKGYWNCSHHNLKIYCTTKCRNYESVHKFLSKYINTCTTLFFLTQQVLVILLSTYKADDISIAKIKPPGYCLNSISSTHRQVPFLQLCSLLCLEDNSCMAFAYDPAARVCVLSSAHGTRYPCGSSNLMSNESKIFDVSGKCNTN